MHAPISPRHFVTASAKPVSRIDLVPNDIRSRHCGDRLVKHQVAVIATPGSATAALAAKAATSTIPIVFSVGSDPVKLGLVDSLNRPGGNITGINYFTQDLGPKRLGLLRELMPADADVVVLVNPKSPITDSALKDLEAAASAVGQRFRSEERRVGKWGRDRRW